MTVCVKDNCCGSGLCLSTGGCFEVAGAELGRAIVRPQLGAGVSDARPRVGGVGFGEGAEFGRFGGGLGRLGGLSLGLGL
jgi:hypothetical protein